MTILYDIFTQIARINFIWPAGSYFDLYEYDVAI